MSDRDRYMLWALLSLVLSVVQHGFWAFAWGAMSVVWTTLSIVAGRQGRR